MARCCQSTSTPLVGTVGNSLAQLAVSLPAAAPDVEFTVAAALPNTSRAMTQTIPVLKPVEIRSALLGRSPIIGDTNDDALLVGLQDPGYPGQYSLQAQLKQGDTVLSSGSLTTGSLGSRLCRGSSRPCPAAYADSGNDLHRGPEHHRPICRSWRQLRR